MRVISHNSTLVGGTPPTSPPGTPTEVPDAEARELIQRGIVHPAGNPAEPLPEFSQEEREAPATGERREEVEGDTVTGGGPNLNTASASELQAIKGVGKKTAGDIVANREADGLFDSLEDAAHRVGGVSLEQLVQAGATV